MTSDARWQEAAERTRRALRQLGYDGPTDCLPREPNACGGSYFQHTVAHLAAIKACADHHLTHAGTEISEMADDIYASTIADLENDCHLGIQQ